MVFGSSKSKGDRRGRRYSYYMKKYCSGSDYKLEQTNCRGVLKVKSLEDSLRSCKDLRSSSQRVRRSQRGASPGKSLRKSGKSLRNLFSKSTKEAPSMELRASATQPLSAPHKSVRFAEIDFRVFPIAPDDNPCVTGSGPGIALSGWEYTAEPSVSLEEYEANRPPRGSIKDLKISIDDRKRLLMDAGASRREVNDFTKRVKQAKLKRAETMEELTTHGKGYLETLAKMESRKHGIQKMLGFRRTGTKEQMVLWDKAQQRTASVA